MTYVLEVRNLVKRYGNVIALDHVNLEVEKGELVVVLGPSGSGKSSLLLSIAGFIKLDEGRILLDGRETQDPGADRGMVFQSYTLYPWLTVKENIAFGLRLKKVPKKEIDDITSYYLDKVGLSGFDNYFPKALSGGMKQRVVIGISISNEPKILIADEPTTNVDVTIQAQLIDLLKRLKKERNTSIILITHNMGLIAEMADRVGVMYAGKMIEIASIDEIFNNPLHPYTRGLLKCVPNPLKKIDRLYSIPGMIPNLIYPPSGCRFHPRCEHAKPICKEKHPPTVEISPGHFVECWLYSEEGEEVSAK